MNHKEVTLHDKSFSVFISADEIAEAVAGVARQIERDMAGETPIFIGVLNGSVLFMADLTRELDMNCELSFVRVSSYSGTSSTGDVKTLLGLNENIEGRTVVLVEDIIDSGLTVKHLLEVLAAYKPSTIKIATLLYKPNAFKGGYKIDYVGKEIPNEFVVGYGLDYDGLGRNLKDIYKIND